MPRRVASSSGAVALVGAATLMALAAACSPPPTGIIVRVDSNMAPQTELISYTVTAQRDGEARTFVDVTFQLADPRARLPATLGLIPHNIDDARTVLVIVTGSVAGGTTVEQRARVAFGAGRVEELDMYLARECIAVGATSHCASDETCVSGGRCESIVRATLPNFGASDASATDASAADTVPTPDVVVLDAQDANDAQDIAVLDSIDAAAFDANDAGARDVANDDGSGPGDTGADVSTADHSDSASADVCPMASCGPCGAAGQPCCTGSVCNAGLACAAGVCTSCGHANEPCCALNACSVLTLACDGVHCVACGGVSQPCCSGDRCNNAVLSCGAGICVACDPSTDCCPPCGTGFTCCPATLRCYDTGCAGCCSMM